MKGRKNRVGAESIQDYRAQMEAKVAISQAWLKWAGLHGFTEK